MNIELACCRSLDEFGRKEAPVQSPLSNESLANRHFKDIEELEDNQVDTLIWALKQKNPKTELSNLVIPEFN